jgi:branched-chain amino acid transport system substrate-binding protein
MRASAPKALLLGLGLSLTLSGCGGTRVSDAAIQAAAGVVTAAPRAVVAEPAAPLIAAPPVATPAPTAPATTSPLPVRGPQPAAAATSRPRAAPVPAPLTSAPPTAKSVIRLGAVGTFSGPVGALVKDTVTGIRVWSQAVNAAGGVNGHPIEVVVGDDGGDPARFNSILQQFVEEQGVLAFLYTTLGMAPNGNNKYLDAKHLFTFSTEGGLEVAYHDPYVLTATPTGFTNADSMILGFSKAIHASGGVKLATFACSDFGLCDNFDQRWSNATVLAKAGFELVARGRPSLTQPDYTSQCLAAKQAGATTILLAMDGASIRRFAGNCARQNYHPTMATADLVVTRDLPADPNVDGLYIGTKMAPFPDTRVPGVAAAHAAFGRYAPGQMITGGMTNGWIIGAFFAAAGRNLPDHPTQRDLADGLYRIKNNNLDGMTYPITMTRGLPVARQLCYGVAVIKARAFTTAPGPSLYCEKNGRPLASVSDY